jgi:hypothetical protein
VFQGHNCLRSTIRKSKAGDDPTNSIRCLPPGVSTIFELEDLGTPSDDEKSGNHGCRPRIPGAHWNVRRNDDCPNQSDQRGPEVIFEVRALLSPNPHCNWIPTVLRDAPILVPCIQILWNLERWCKGRPRTAPLGQILPAGWPP